MRMDDDDDDDGDDVKSASVRFSYYDKKWFAILI